MAGVYLMQDPETKENLYVGSSIHLRSRELEHRNPNFRNHAGFGKYIHKEGIAKKVVFTVLESVKHDDPETRKKLCRAAEFRWKKKIPCKFCEVFDGLCLQPEDVKREHKLMKREKRKDQISSKIRFCLVSYYIFEPVQNLRQ